MNFSRSDKNENYSDFDEDDYEDLDDDEIDDPEDDYLIDAKLDWLIHAIQMYGSKHQYEEIENLILKQTKPSYVHGFNN